MDQQTTPSAASQPPNLFTIPLEILSMILEQFFCSTEPIRIGFPNPVASQRTPILRTCRKIHSEASRLLSPSLFTYHFASTCRMVDELINMPQSTISQLRNIRVKGYSFPLHTNEEYYTTYDCAYTLPLFPGLQLDRLIIEDTYHDEGDDGGWSDGASYYDVCSLIESDGWKEIWYVSPTTSFLTGTRSATTLEAAQPQAWDKKIKQRDGEDSGAECKLHIAKEAGKVGGAENESTREGWQVAAPSTTWGAVRPKGDGIDDREVLVVVKRARNAKYVNDGSKLDPDIKRLFDELSWDEIKETRYVPPEDDPSAHL
ncbi:hypothetical protein ACMFMG_005377 [Clarireedia jacksonii]